MKLVQRNLWLLLLMLVSAISLAALACGEDDGDNGDNGDRTPSATEDGEDGDDGLSSIPEDTTGVTDTEIVLGSHMPLSGVAAIYGNAIVPGMQAYFDHINDQGGINGRMIRFIVEDDGYDPSQTNQVVRKLVEQDQVFALVSGLGTAQHSAAFEYLKDNLIPDLFVATGATKFTDPVTRTAFGFNPNYIQEGRALGQYIAQEYPDAKLGLILQNDDFGADGRKGIEEGIEGSDVEIIAAQTYEAVQTDMTSQIQNLQNAGATVVAAYALPRQAGSIVSVARQQLDYDVPIIVSGVVADQLTIALMNNNVPGTAAGVVTAAYLTPLESGGDAIDEHVRILGQYAADARPSNITIYGQSVAEMVVHVLELAGDDLNRRSVIAAAESVRDFLCSLCIAPINLSPTDHRPMEGFRLARVENDAFVPFGDIISYESTANGGGSDEEEDE